MKIYLVALMITSLMLYLYIRYLYYAASLNDEVDTYIDDCSNKSKEAENIFTGLGRN
ncbi:hypothetical protein [Mammaliicoccus sciuri]|uniref:hypothetical protein n=1 Tax=Mammaliicoccus sciuri TaxID=1296 RepID=UPI001304AFE2|nr:hypothetical protein [Mammaliicoccus sciuri]